MWKNSTPIKSKSCSRKFSSSLLWWMNYEYILGIIQLFKIEFLSKFTTRPTLFLGLFDPKYWTNFGAIWTRFRFGLTVLWFVCSSKSQHYQTHMLGILLEKCKRNHFKNYWFDNFWLSEDMLPSSDKTKGDVWLNSTFFSIWPTT